MNYYIELQSLMMNIDAYWIVIWLIDWFIDHQTAAHAFIQDLQLDIVF